MERGVFSRKSRDLHSGAGHTPVGGVLEARSRLALAEQRLQDPNELRGCLKNGCHSSCWESVWQSP